MKMDMNYYLFIYLPIMNEFDIEIYLFYPNHK
jgi:hypothetical protein